MIGESSGAAGATAAGAATAAGDATAARASPSAGAVPAGGAASDVGASPAAGAASTPDVPREAGAVLAIVPAHDEATRVAAVVEGLTAQGLPVLVVDDGSTDGTGLMAEGAGARVLRLEPNQGKGAALKAGFRLALAETADEGVPASAGGTSVGFDRDSQPDSHAHRPDEPPAGAAEVIGLWAAILTLDGDGQHDPAEVPAFLRIWGETGADLVVGARDYRRMPPIRWFTNTVSRRLFSWALGERILDNQSGFRLCSRRLAAAALSSPERGFAFEVEEIAICVGRGYRLAWVPIRTIYGTESSDIKPWAHFVGFLRVTRRARRRMREERSRMSGR